jgi:hypothetical protein
MKSTIRLTALALAFAALASVAASRSGFAQAGATGGQLGKQNKSLSGDRNEPAPAPATSPAPSNPPTASPKRSSGPKTFHDPRVNGVRVDWCMTPAMSGCGEGAADAWCKSQGFTHSTDFKWSVAPPTYRLGSRDVCNGFCGGFTEVTCE